MHPTCQIIVSAIAGVLVGGSLVLVKAQQTEDTLDRLQELENFYRVHDVILAHYTDAARIGTRFLVQSALRGMVGGLDAHSQYFPPDVYARIKSLGRGELTGVGLTLSGTDGGARVVAVLPGSPSENAGIEIGARLTRVDGQSVAALFISEIIERLRGPEGTEVTLEFVNETSGSVKATTLRRALLRISSVTRAELLRGTGGNVALIKVAYFNDDAASEFSSRLQPLLAEKPVAIVLDLRGNPGGSLDAAVGIASFFLDKDQTIARIQGRDASQLKTIIVESSARLAALPVAVLVDRGTSSAAEMLAAALQEHKRGVIVGERTFGKGSIQSLFDLPDGAGLRLTTAYYLTPSGRRIEENGVIPDIEVIHTPAHQTALRARELGLDAAGAEEPPVDEQLQRAADALRAVAAFRRKSAGS